MRHPVNRVHALRLTLTGYGVRIPHRIVNLGIVESVFAEFRPPARSHYKLNLFPYTPPVHWAQEDA